MIKTKMGEITIKGNKAELLADLATIIRALKEAFVESKETEESAQQKINDIVKVGLMNESEYKDHMKKALGAMFDKILGGIFDEDKGE